MSVSRALIAWALCAMTLPAMTSADTVTVLNAEGQHVQDVWSSPRTGGMSPLCWQATGGLTGLTSSRSGFMYRTFGAPTAVPWKAVQPETEMRAELSPNCRLAAEGHYIFPGSSGFPGGILVRDASGRGVARVLAKKWVEGESYAWSRDSRRLAVAMEEPQAGMPTLRVIDVTTGRGLRRHVPREFLSEPLSGDAFSPDGRAVVFASERGAQVLEIASGTVRPVSPDVGRQDLGGPLAWSPDGRTIAGYDWRRGIVLVDVATGAQTAVAEGAGLVEEIVWSPDSSRLAFLFTDGRDLARMGLGLVRAEAGAAARRPPMLRAATTVAPRWSPDGTRVAVWRTARGARR